MPPAEPGRGRRPRFGSIAGWAGALCVLAGCVVNEPQASPGEVGAPHPRVGEISAPGSAVGSQESPGISVGFVIDDPAVATVVVTKLRPLNPADYVPSDLVFIGSVPGGGDQQLRVDAADAISRMYGDALAAGVPFRVSTAYRSYSFQESLYRGYVESFGREQADRVSARPGFSEHQTGLAADVFDVEANRLAESFGSSPAGEWLAANAHTYGYIISYPAGKEDVTGYQWEPWHVRFVGIEAATTMRDRGVLTLQEYLGVEPSPDYE